MADEKQTETRTGQGLRASVARLEARARDIPAWKMGTIVFAEPARTPPPSPPTGASTPPK